MAPCRKVRAYRCGSRNSSFRRRVVVDNLPAVRTLTEEQRKQSVRRFPILHSELPRSPHQGGIGRERCYLEIRKLKLSHLVAFALISLAIALKGILPADSHIRAGGGHAGSRRPAGAQVRPERLL